MMTKIRNCPACDTDDARFVSDKGSFSIYVCKKCRTLYTDRLPNIDEEENYDEYYNETNLAVPSFIAKRLDQIIRRFDPYKLNGRLLDIGFGAGSILESGKKLGWAVSGQEVSKPAVENAIKKGFDVFWGELTDAHFPYGHFDVVTCSEILEHVPTPIEMLSEIHRILRPGGLFWATTPSATGISFRLLKQSWSVLSPPEHTQLYSHTAMRKLLEKAGFRSATILTEGVNPYEIINKRIKSSKAAPIDRVRSGYALNESLSEGGFRILIKNSANSILNATRLGDSLKIFATK